MSKALENVKAVVQIALNIAVLAIFVVILSNFRDLKLATQKALEQASVGSINLFGVEIKLGQNGVDYALFKYGYLSDTDKENIRLQIHGLTAKEFERLMYVGQCVDQFPPDLCQYKNPTPEMREDLAADNKLQEKKLTKKADSPDILSRAKEKREKAIAQGENWDIGDPLWCYEMALTPAGYDVKTVLIKNLSMAFGQGRTASP
jgi:hypothetical protein